MRETIRRAQVRKVYKEDLAQHIRGNISNLGLEKVKVVTIANCVYRKHALVCYEHCVCL